VLSHAHATKGTLPWIPVLLFALTSPVCVFGQDGLSPAHPNLLDPIRAAEGTSTGAGGSGLALTPLYLPDESGRSTQFEASDYISLDSWIYPAFDRLAALGYLPDSTAMIRPWTRLEGARLVDEAHQQFFSLDDVGESLLAALDTEFAAETRVREGGSNRKAEVESAYTRFTGIGGTPLRDGYHFSQTLVNDFGRPYGKGANVISGFSTRASAGPFAVYFRGEYQYASALPTSIYSAQLQQSIASQDLLPFGWNLRFGVTDRLRPVEAYVALNLHDWQLTFGQQSLWWGADRSTSLILSNNAAPMPMLRLDRVKPAFLPGPLRLLGPIHLDLFMARQGGIHFLELGPNFIPYGVSNRAITPPPYLWGVDISMKPTQNFELGFAHTTIFAGYGRPLTFGTFLHTFSPYGNLQAVDPGKRVTEINLNYHLPGFRRAIQVFSEGMAWDDPLQGKFISRFVWDPGVYLSELPKLHHLDARFEAVYTDPPKEDHQGYFYSNAHYPQGYTNYGQIMGSWVGRQGIGGQASSTYWFSPQKKVDVFYRKMVSDVSVLGGGSNGDFGSDVSWRIRPEIELVGQAQYERWKFPMLNQNARSDFSGSAGVRFYPAIATRSR
jgi:hypothetical protein